MFTQSPVSPAQSLEGQSLPNGWTVVQALPSPSQRGGTGGNFSVGYIVESASGTSAFLKALDLSRALTLPDVTRALQFMTEAYNFERDILARCRDRRLDRVVVAVDDGQVVVNGLAVPYLIFERADGDIREQMNTLTANVDVAWKLRSLHHIAAALRQLHGIDIAHQDLKPSNVLMFGDKEAKLADLGRAGSKGNPQPHDQLPFAGDPTYAPPELLYGAGDPNDWNQRCFGCDAYHLGSMAVFFFLGAGTTPLVISKLQPPQCPGTWGGRYQDVLLHIRDAFNEVLDAFEQGTPADYRPDLLEAVRQLCEPDPNLRGHPRQRARAGANPFDLERYVSLFNRLASGAEITMRRGPQP